MSKARVPLPDGRLVDTPPPDVPLPDAPPPEHGGRLLAAARRYGIPPGEWVDLSTGINPVGYPPPPVPASAWLRLPEDDDALSNAASDYFGTNQVLPVAGSQAAIQALAQHLPGKRVTLLAPSYAEHAHAWRKRALHPCSGTAEIEAALPDTDILVLVNPNNPSGATFPAALLREWHCMLARRGGWLVVDEAFADAEPQHSLAGLAGQPGLVILRSLGKFFGLAGARVGFVLADVALRHALAAHLGPWTIAGPSRFVAAAALADRPWQAACRARLIADAARLAALLDRHPLLSGKGGGTALFQWRCTPHARAFHEHFARRGILLRLFEHPASLRFGLPATEQAWQRLGQALLELRTP